jgi:hypothetical protein
LPSTLVVATSLPLWSNATLPAQPFLPYERGAVHRLDRRADGRAVRSPAFAQAAVHQHPAE